MNTFKNEQYTITSSLNDGTIYIEVANNISYASYEGKFDLSAFRLSFGLNEIYILINNSFTEFVKEKYDIAGKDEYQLNPVIDNGMLLLNFHCIVSGFLNMEFSLKLRKKIVSVDEQLLGELNKQKQMIDTLMRNYNDSVIEKTQISLDINKLTHQVKELEEVLREKDEKISQLLCENKRLNSIMPKYPNISFQNLRLDGELEFDDEDGIVVTERFIGDVLYYVDADDNWYNSAYEPIEKPANV